MKEKNTDLLSAVESMLQYEGSLVSEEEATLMDMLVHLSKDIVNGDKEAMKLYEKVSIMLEELGEEEVNEVDEVINIDDFIEECTADEIAYICEYLGIGFEEYTLEEDLEEVKGMLVTLIDPDALHEAILDLLEASEDEVVEVIDLEHLVGIIEDELQEIAEVLVEEFGNGLENIALIEGIILGAEIVLRKLEDLAVE